MKIVIIQILSLGLVSSCSNSKFAGSQEERKPANTQPQATPPANPNFDAKGAPTQDGLQTRINPTGNEQLVQQPQGTSQQKRTGDVLVESTSLKDEKMCDPERGYVKPVGAIVSRTYNAGHAQQLAYDCHPRTMWNAGETGAHYYTADLGGEIKLDRVYFTLAYTANRNDAQKASAYQVFIGSNPNSLTHVKSFNLQSGTLDGHKFALLLADSHPPVRYIKILTTYTTSWVAWFEIEPYKKMP